MYFIGYVDEENAPISVPSPAASGVERQNPARAVEWLSLTNRFAAMPFPTIESTVGNTPLVRLQRLPG
ncbi:MAG: hypothetical protein M0R02_15760, partial [Bacteroidales bacterium]|nr:hypothetical protein [Bacteroidales bacterium]